MVYGRVIEGHPREIGEKIAELVGDRRVSVVLVETPAETLAAGVTRSQAEIDQALADITADAVSVGHVDDSREALYTRQDGE